MSRPLRIEYPGAFYHATSRGNERKEIFKSDGDREKFLFYLASAAERYGALFHAYCLMTNHYHLMIETPQGNLSQIMKHINNSYTNYYNVKHKRAGHLLQGRYKAILVEADTYAAELSRYIHLNPVRAKMVEAPEDHLWEKQLNGKEPDRDLPALRELTGRKSPEEIRDMAVEAFAESGRKARGAGVFLCHRYSGAKLKEIGKLFGFSESGVTQASGRFEDAMGKDSSLGKKIQKIIEKVKL